jgi:hypothetical protein
MVKGRPAASDHLGWGKKYQFKKPRTMELLIIKTGVVFRSSVAFTFMVSKSELPMFPFNTPCSKHGMLETVDATRITSFEANPGWKLSLTRLGRQLLTLIQAPPNQA